MRRGGAGREHDGAVVTGASDPPPDTPARTAWQADKERFFARRAHRPPRGLLKLQHSDDRWGLERQAAPVRRLPGRSRRHRAQDGGLPAQRAEPRGQEPQLRQIDGEVTYTTGDKQPVAALRSGGLGVSRHGRAAPVARMPPRPRSRTARRGPQRQGGVLRRGRAARLPRRRAAVKERGRWHSLCAQRQLPTDRHRRADVARRRGLREGRLDHQHASRRTTITTCTN